MSTAAHTQVVADAPTLDSEEAQAKSGSKKLVLIACVGALVILGYFGYRTLTAGTQSTDDAIVDADVVPVSVRVGGAVAKLMVKDDARVKKGDVLVELDANELQAKLKQAEGELEAAKAQALAADAQQQVTEAGARGGLSSSRAQVSTSRAQVLSAVAQIANAQAQLVRATAEAKRAAIDLENNRQLFRANAVARDRLDTAQTTSDSAQASLDAARAQLSAAEEARRVAESRVAEAAGMLDTNIPIDAKIASAKGAAQYAQARVLTAEAALDLARLALSYTKVIATTDGIVSRLSVREGQLLAAGQSIGSIVPESTYIVANFKETQVGTMRAGQEVDIEVDAFPGQHFHGVLTSLAGGTGSRFSMLAPDNAAGNFVKVVQRVPVRIDWQNLPEGVSLRAGMSAAASVDTRH
jgi:membrane fusion protein (multidrug efflux system)